MKNQTTLILLVVSVLAIVFITIYGIKIGDFEILSIKQLIEKNNTLNSKISTASSLTSSEYPEAIRTLEERYKEHTIQKQKYEQMIGLTSDSEEKVYETKQYDIDYLWRVIGSYAADQNLKVVMSVQKTTGQNLYNCNFSVTGLYSNIIKFISKIENNSDLNFRIYNFKMTGETEIVTSTFVIKNINIDPDTTIKDNFSAITDGFTVEKNTEKE